MRKRNRYCLTIKVTILISFFFSSQLLTVKNPPPEIYKYMYIYICTCTYRSTRFAEKKNKNEKTTPKSKVTEEH